MEMARATEALNPLLNLREPFCCEQNDPPPRNGVLDGYRKT